MIVNRVHAEEAAKVLQLASLDGLTKDMLSVAYKAVARAAHPDAGGSHDQFAEVGRCKTVLEAWLARQPSDRPKGLAATDCARCAGAGRIKLQKGFTSYTVKCVTCNGTGDGGYDHDRQVE